MWLGSFSSTEVQSLRELFRCEELAREEGEERSARHVTELRKEVKQRGAGTTLRVEPSRLRVRGCSQPQGIRPQTTEG